MPLTSDTYPTHPVLAIFASARSRLVSCCYAINNLSNSDDIHYMIIYYQHLCNFIISCCQQQPSQGGLARTRSKVLLKSCRIVASSCDRGLGVDSRPAASDGAPRTTRRPSERSELHKSGHMTTGHWLFCKEFLCFNTVPCCHMLLLVHF